MQTRFGISPKLNLITVQARVLDGPRIKYGGLNAPMTAGGWNPVNKRFSSPGSITRWGCMYLSVPGDNVFKSRQDLERPLEELRTVLQSMGVNIGRHSSLERIELTGQNDHVLDKKLIYISKTVELLLIVISNNRMGIYDRIKSLCDIQLGLPTICTLANNLQTVKDSYVHNIALKFNLKLGGHNQEVATRQATFLDADTTMIVGIDVTHPSPGSAGNAPSVAGMVANVNKRMGQWPAVLSVQERARMEMGRYQPVVFKVTLASSSLLRTIKASPLS